MKKLTSRIPTLFGITLLAAVMVFTFASCENDPPESKDSEIPAALQGTWSDAEGNELIFTKDGVTVTSGGQSKTYTLKDSKTEGKKTTFYFSDSKEEDYIVYQDGAITEINFDGVQKTGAWEKEEPILDESDYGDFTYIVTEQSTITITGYTGKGGNVIIPSEIDGKPVTVIKDGISNETGDPYNYIDGGFHNKQLTGVTIPNTVTYIGDYAFSINQLTSVFIPNSVTYIGEYAFMANQLTSVNIPNSVTSIGYGAFMGNQLTSVNIPNSITSINAFTFDANKLTSVTIPNSVTSILGYAFMNNQLTNVNIPDSVTYIGFGAFENNQLTSITIPKNVTNIEGAAFYNNPLTNLSVDSGNTSYITKNFLLLSFDEKELNFYYGNEKIFTIPNGITSIEGLAFFNKQLTSVTIPNSVTSIGYSAFGNNQLTSVTIPNSVTSIGMWAFSNNQLTNITIGSNVTLDDGAFDDTIEYSSGFETAYDSYSKQAGTYTRPNTSSTTWTWNP